MFIRLSIGDDNETRERGLFLGFEFFDGGLG
jgi:hypothetical protein